MNLSDFDYGLDPSLIAQAPLARRDGSRFLVLSRKSGKMDHRFFYELPRYLLPEDLLIVNDTKVFAARLHARKQATGGRVELLLIRPGLEHTWEALVSGRTHPGQRILFEDGSVGEILEGPRNGRVRVRIDANGDFSNWLEGVGRTPLPPYIKRPGSNGEREAADRNAYQTVYASVPGSVAAPTAGIHFTPSLMDEIRRMGVKIRSVTLHIGPGTFRPVRDGAGGGTKALMTEYYRVPEETVAAMREVRSGGGRIIAVGTSTVRALESAADDQGSPAPKSGWTDLWITPGHAFKTIDAMITNFHMPRSSLLMLVAALAGRDRLFAAYGEATRSRYRFYSFGDAMLII